MRTNLSSLSSLPTIMYFNHKSCFLALPLIPLRHLLTLERRLVCLRVVCACEGVTEHLDLGKPSVSVGGDFSGTCGTTVGSRYQVGGDASGVEAGMEEAGSENPAPWSCNPLDSARDKGTNDGQGGRSTFKQQHLARRGRRHRRHVPLVALLKVWEPNETTADCLQEGASLILHRVCAPNSRRRIATAPYSIELVTNKQSKIELLQGPTSTTQGSCPACPMSTFYCPRRPTSLSSVSISHLSMLTARGRKGIPSTWASVLSSWQEADVVGCLFAITQVDPTSGVEVMIDVKEGSGAGRHGQYAPSAATLGLMTNQGAGAVSGKSPKLQRLKAEMGTDLSTSVPPANSKSHSFAAATTIYVTYRIYLTEESGASFCLERQVRPELAIHNRILNSLHGTCWAIVNARVPGGGKGNASSGSVCGVNSSRTRGEVLETLTPGFASLRGALTYGEWTSATEGALSSPCPATLGGSPGFHLAAPLDALKKWSETSQGQHAVHFERQRLQVVLAAKARRQLLRGSIEVGGLDRRGTGKGGHMDGLTSTTPHQIEHEGGPRMLGCGNGRQEGQVVGNVRALYPLIHEVGICTDISRPAVSVVGSDPVGEGGRGKQVALGGLHIRVDTGAGSPLFYLREALFEEFLVHALDKTTDKMASAVRSECAMPLRSELQDTEAELVSSPSRDQYSTTAVLLRQAQAVIAWAKSDELGQHQSKAHFCCPVRTQGRGGGSGSSSEICCDGGIDTKGLDWSSSNLDRKSIALLAATLAKLISEGRLKGMGMNHSRANRGRFEPQIVAHSGDRLRFDTETSARSLAEEVRETVRTENQHSGGNDSLVCSRGLSGECYPVVQSGTGQKGGSSSIVQHSPPLPEMFLAHLAQVCGLTQLEFFFQKVEEGDCPIARIVGVEQSVRNSKVPQTRGPGVSTSRHTCRLEVTEILPLDTAALAGVLLADLSACYPPLRGAGRS
ncbi:unnamed protein product [Choristocarpus tenellus]